MIIKELLSPIDLSGAQVLCIQKTLEVIVICKDKNPIFAIFQVMMLSFECFNNSQKLIVVGLILYSCWNHYPQKKCY